MKNKYGNNSRLLFTDTDSLMYEIKIEDVYKDFIKDHFSNFSFNSIYYDGSNRLIVVKMKDKTGDVSIEKFIGLKPNTYSFVVDDSVEHKKAKYVNKNLVATISQDKYENILLNQKRLRHSMISIQSNKHRIGTYEINKNLFIML